MLRSILEFLGIRKKEKKIQTVIPPAIERPAVASQTKVEEPKPVEAPKPVASNPTPVAPVADPVKAEPSPSANGANNRPKKKYKRNYHRKPKQKKPTQS